MIHDFIFKQVSRLETQSKLYLPSHRLDFKLGCPSTNHHNNYCFYHPASLAASLISPAMSLPASWSHLWRRIAPERAADQPQPLLDQEPQVPDWDWGSGDSEHEPIQDNPGPVRSAAGSAKPEGDNPSSQDDRSPSESGENGFDEEDEEEEEEEEDEEDGGSDDDGSDDDGSDDDGSGDDNSGDDDDDDSNETDDSDDESSGEKRRNRTKKAREVAKKNKLMRKMAKMYEVDVPARHSEYLPFLKGEDDRLTGPGQHQKHFTRKRMRLLYSWLKGMCSFLNSFFEGQKCEHLISVSVIDDTNMQLASTVCRQWQTSRTVTVLNNVQTCVACFHSVDEYNTKHADYKSIALHTPPSALARANAHGLIHELRSWQISELGSGTRWEHFGLKPDLISSIPLVCQVLCFDSLSTNIRLLKMLRRINCQKQKDQQAANQVQTQTQLLSGFVCGIHQLALARKTLLFHHGGFWASIVRLSHLFQASNFRAQFRTAMFAVIVDNFRHIPVQSMPVAHTEWRTDRNNICNMIAQDENPRHSRMRFHRELMKWDNGDSSCDSLTHWCVGSCCQGETPEAKAEYSLAMICKYYYYLFAFGFDVPLTYRWKHASHALRYCEDSWLARDGVQNADDTPCFC